MSEVTVCGSFAHLSEMVEGRSGWVLCARSYSLRRHVRRMNSSSVNDAEQLSRGAVRPPWPQRLVDGGCEFRDEFVGEHAQVVARRRAHGETAIDYL